MKLFGSIGYVRLRTVTVVAVKDLPEKEITQLRTYSLHEDLPHVCIDLLDSGRARRPAPTTPRSPAGGWGAA